MTKNKDPMLQELGTLINNRTATQKAQAPFNEQAASLIECSLDLIKQVLVKHSAAVLEEMHDQIVARNDRISKLEGSVSTLESECNQLNDMTIKRWALIEDLASMCRRLSYSVKRSGNDKLAHQCVELLKKHDLGGSVLREMNSSEGSTSRDGGQNPVVTPTKPPVDISRYKFEQVSCSQCGGEFGPGDNGFSHCENHKHLPRLG